MPIYTEYDIKKLQTLSQKIRRTSVEMALHAGRNGAHLGGSLSCVEILSVLYGAIMNYNLLQRNDDARDRFILSKGHAALSFYATLMEAGFISTDQIPYYKANGSLLSGHPVMNCDMGIEFSSGSLGQGLSLGCGNALALKVKGNVLSRIFVLLGDGECNEGSIWEAALFANHHNLNNLCVIVDQNGLQYDGPTSCILDMGDLRAKWECFGFTALSVDGHSEEALYTALSHKTDRPLAIIAKTVKGKGFSFMENIPSWHHAILTGENYALAIKELEFTQ